MPPWRQQRQGSYPRCVCAGAAPPAPPAAQMPPGEANRLRCCTRLVHSWAGEGGVGQEWCEIMGDLWHGHRGHGTGQDSARTEATRRLALWSITAVSAHPVRCTQHVQCQCRQYQQAAMLFSREAVSGCPGPSIFSRASLARVKQVRASAYWPVNQHMVARQPGVDAGHEQTGKGRGRKEAQRLAATGAVGRRRGSKYRGRQGRRAAWTLAAGAVEAVVEEPCEYVCTAVWHCNCSDCTWKGNHCSVSPPFHEYT